MFHRSPPPSPSPVDGEGGKSFSYLNPRLGPFSRAPSSEKLEGNRITNSFGDPINGSMILFAPIGHRALFPGNEASFAASDLPGRVLESGSLRLGMHAVVH